MNGWESASSWKPQSYLPTKKISCLWYGQSKSKQNCLLPIAYSSGFLCPLPNLAFIPFLAMSTEFRDATSNKLEIRSDYSAFQIGFKLILVYLSIYYQAVCLLLTSSPISVLLLPFTKQVLQYPAHFDHIHFEHKLWAFCINSIVWNIFLFPSLCMHVVTLF